MALPLAPLIWLAIWLYMRNRKGGAGGVDLSPGFWLFVWIICIWNSVFVAGLLFGGAAVSENPAWALPALAAAVFCFPWTFARWVLIPAGWTRAAYYVLRIPGTTLWKDRRGGALAGAVWAHTRSGRRSPRVDEWLQKKLAALSPLKAGGVAALALSRAAEGEIDFARGLMRLVLAFDRNARPRRILRIAVEWLAAEAATRGDWEAVRAIGSRRGVRTRWTLFASLAARRLLGESRPHALLLRAAWLLAPNRIGSLDLLRLALAGRQDAPVQREEGELPATFSDLLRLHAALWKEGPASAGDLDRVQLGWSRLFVKGVAGGLRERAAAIAAANAEHVWEEAKARIVGDLASMVREHGHSLAALTPSGLTEDIRARLEDEGMEELEHAAGALARRRANQQVLPVHDELVEWCALWDLYESLAGVASNGLRPLAFASVYPAASGHAVWLFNERGERPLGNALLRVLLEEARNAGDAEAERLQAANVAIPI